MSDSVKSKDVDVGELIAVESKGTSRIGARGSLYVACHAAETSKAYMSDCQWRRYCTEIRHPSRRNIEDARSHLMLCGRHHMGAC